MDYLRNQIREDDEEDLGFGRWIKQKAKKAGKGLAREAGRAAGRAIVNEIGN